MVRTQGSVTSLVKAVVLAKVGGVLQLVDGSDGPVCSGRLDVTHSEGQSHGEKNQNLPLMLLVWYLKFS